MQHQSSDNTTVKERLKKFGNIVACYGESIAFACMDARETLCMLLIDDGSKTRGQRNNIFKPEFNHMSCFTGPHADCETMTCIDYAGAFTPLGEDPIQNFMAEFLKEEVDFEMPADVRSWKQKSKVNVKGQLATKVTTREIKFKNGNSDTLEKTETRNIDL